MEVLSLPRGAGTLQLSPRLLAPFSDNRLVEQIRRGNDAAFEVVYDRHHRGLLSFCRHMLGSPEEAEDAVQQTFVAAYRDLVASDKPIRLKPWLYAIARNRCLDVLRARREEAAEIADIPTAGLAESVLEREEVRRLLGDVRRLPDDQRAALVLSELGDLSHTEIAEIVGCEAVQVKALVFQARSSLLASREAADVPCHEIREQIANARGAALRRGLLRRHMRGCPACAEYRDQIRRQRELLALILPVAPTAALKDSVLGSIGLGHAAAGGGVAGGAAAGGTVGCGGATSGGVAAGGVAAGAGGATGGGVLAGVGALGGAKLAVLAIAAAGVAGGGIVVENATSPATNDGTSATSTNAKASGTSPVPIPRAFGARFGAGFAAAAAGGAPASARGSGSGNGRGKGKGNANGGGNGSGSGAGQSSTSKGSSGLTFDPHTQGNGTGRGQGHYGGPPSYAGSGSAGGNSAGSAGGGGGGNGYGPPASAVPPTTPPGHAYGVYGQPPSSSGQHGGPPVDNPGQGAGHGLGGG